MNPPIFVSTQGTLPLLISMPHVGRQLPPDLAAQMTPAAREVPDTDWHIERLYAFAAEMGASTLQAQYSRYVVDLNRPSDGQSLYPGQNTTGLCPTETFHAEPVYADGVATPGPEETARRVAEFWQPYHRALQDEIARLKALHGRVLVWEAHSIASVLPHLFDGELPTLNIGTFEGRACAPPVREAVRQAAAGSPFSFVLDGRFKGGFITRQYGRPDDGVHLVQLELAQCAYMQEVSPFAWDDARAASLIPTLRAMVAGALSALPASPA